jgi:hypothetical protein
LTAFAAAEASVAEAMKFLRLTGVIVNISDLWLEWPVRRYRGGFARFAHTSWKRSTVLSWQE